MPKLTLRHWLLYVLPLLTVVVGPFVLAGASSYLEHREDLQLARNVEMVQSRPEAVVEETEYDFGVMEGLAEGSHAFVIRNQGGGALELRLGEPSSPSVRAELARATVPPGQAAEVRVIWNTLPCRAEYSEGVTVETNDKGHKSISLTVHGKVRVQVAAEPKQLVIPQVTPGEPATASTLVYSHLWPDLTITKVSCSIDHAQGSSVPAHSEALQAVQGVAGHSVSVIVPGDMPSGPFRAMVRIEAQRTPSASAERIGLELPLSGKVLRRLAVYGDGVQQNGVVDLGIHPQGKAWRHRLLLKVRDENTDLPLTGIQTIPDFLGISLLPYGHEGATRLYRLDISASADASQCIYRGMKLGELKLTFDHPRIPHLTLGLTLAVMPNP